MDQDCIREENHSLSSAHPLQSVSWGSSIRSRLIGREQSSNWKCNIDLCLCTATGLHWLALKFRLWSGGVIFVCLADTLAWLVRMWMKQHVTCTIWEHMLLCASYMKSVLTSPCNAPVWFNALDSGVFYVLEGEALPDLGMIHTHADLHWANTGYRRCRVAHYLRHGPSMSEAELQHYWNYFNLHQFSSKSICMFWKVKQKTF